MSPPKPFVLAWVIATKMPSPEIKEGIEKDALDIITLHSQGKPIPYEWDHYKRTQQACFSEVEFDPDPATEEKEVSLICKRIKDLIFLGRVETSEGQTFLITVLHIWTTPVIDTNLGANQRKSYMIKFGEYVPGTDIYLDFP